MKLIGQAQQDIISHMIATVNPTFLGTFANLALELGDDLKDPLFDMHQELVILKECFDFDASDPKNDEASLSRIRAYLKRDWETYSIAPDVAMWSETSCRRRESERTSCAQEHDRALAEQAGGGLQVGLVHRVVRTSHAGACIALGPRPQRGLRAQSEHARHACVFPR